MQQKPGRRTPPFVERQVCLECEPNADTPSVPDGLRGSEVIVLAEDNARVRQALHEALELYGYTVLPVADGAAALALCKSLSAPPDLLIADAHMPGLDGRQVVQELARIGRLPNILVMSGGTSSRVGVLARGAVAYGAITKPFSPEQLARRIRRLLRTPPRHVDLDVARGDSTDIAPGRL